MIIICVEMDWLYFPPGQPQLNIITIIIHHYHHHHYHHHRHHHNLWWIEVYFPLDSPSWTVICQLPPPPPTWTHCSVLMHKYKYTTSCTICSIKYTAQWRRTESIWIRVIFSNWVAHVCVRKGVGGGDVGHWDGLVGGTHVPQEKPW